MCENWKVRALESKPHDRIHTNWNFVACPWAQLSVSVPLLFFSSLFNSWLIATKVRMLLRNTFSKGAYTFAREHKRRRPRRRIREHMPWLQHEAKCCRSPSQWMILLKYRLQADSVRSASDRAEPVFLSSVTHLHCYACLALACLAHVFVLMWTRLNMCIPHVENGWVMQNFWSNPHTYHHFHSKWNIVICCLPLDTTMSICFKDLLRSPEKKFDVLFVQLLPMYECYLPIAHELRIPVIGTFSARPWAEVEVELGNPHPIIYPFIFSSFATKMTLYQRLVNAVDHVTMQYIYKFVLPSMLQQFFQKHFPAYDLRASKEISLLFTNNHPVLFPKPVVPNEIEIGGVHLKPPKSLPEVNFWPRLHFLSLPAFKISQICRISKHFWTSPKTALFYFRWARLPDPKPLIRTWGGFSETLLQKYRWGLFGNWTRKWKTYLRMFGSRSGCHKKIYWVSYIE